MNFGHTLESELEWVSRYNAKRNLSFAKTSSAFGFNNLGIPDITC
jgi:hypothetical protein